MKVGGKNENNPFNDNLIFLPSVATNGLIGNKRAYSYYIAYSWGNIHLIRSRIQMFKSSLDKFFSDANTNQGDPIRT